uniref:Uncharacterized protein n=1 Tax=Pipistrellus kuhlii TaxID=59472 RepID=A0A7J7SMI9_PIPKU|nr:hypothetical protein mPipKuh1_009806 [Pipistrellus kuhlii]
MPEQATAPSSPFSPGVGSLEAMESSRKVLLSSSLEWRVTQPGCCCGKRASLIFSEPQSGRTGFLNWNHTHTPGGHANRPQGSVTLRVLTTALAAASHVHIHAELPLRAFLELTAQPENWTMPWTVSPSVRPQGVGFYVLLDLVCLI